mgnify:FL=1
MDHKTLFSKTKPVRLFFMAAIPGSVGMLASSLYQLMDGIMVGQLLEDAAFAALNLAMPFVIVNFALADLIGVGSSVPISIHLGAKNEKKANNIFTCACIMIEAVGVLFGAALYFAAPALIGLMGAEGELATFAVQYLRVYALSSPLTTIIYAVDNYLRICGKIKGSMFLNIIMSALCAGLEFVFLYFFKWGIWGAALGTCCGMAVCAVIAFWPFFCGKMQLRFTKPQFSMQMIKQIMACGSPAFLNNVAGRVTSVIMNAILLRMGGADAVSIYGVLMYVDGFVLPLLYGMCDSLQPAVGYNWGAGDRHRVKAIEKCCYTAALVLSVTSAAVIMIFPKPIAGLFISGGQTALLDAAAPALMLFGLTYITRWFSFATQSFMAAIEKPGAASAISVATALIFPLIFIGVLWPLDLTGLWLNMPATALAAGALSAVLLVLFLKKQKKTGSNSRSAGR